MRSLSVPVFKTLKLGSGGWAGGNGKEGQMHIFGEGTYK